MICTQLIRHNYYIECPARIKRAFAIHDWVENLEDNFKNVFKMNMGRDIVNALYVELSDIYRGLLFQQKSVSYFNNSHKHIDLLKSKCHLTSAVNLCESHERDNCSEEFGASIMLKFMPCDTDVSSATSNDNVEWNTKCRSTADRHNSVNGRNEQKCLLYSRSVEAVENKKTVTTLANDYEKQRNLSRIFVTKTNVAGVTISDVQCGKECPGRSPTVNISWFIAKAYLANLYYTTQRDVSLTIQTCDDITDVYRQSHMNQTFAEKTFPVMLSTQWTCIYDKEIQQVLGFYSLSSYVLDKCSSRSVYLGVCPVQFALFVKVRTGLVHGSSSWIINKYVTTAVNIWKHVDVIRRLLGLR